MPAVLIFGMAASVISFFVLFFVKICGESGRMKICKVLHVDTAPETLLEVHDSNTPVLQPRPILGRKQGQRHNSVRIRNRAA